MDSSKKKTAYLDHSWLAGHIVAVAAVVVGIQNSTLVALASYQAVVAAVEVAVTVAVADRAYLADEEDLLVDYKKTKHLLNSILWQLWLTTLQVCS